MFSSGEPTEIPLRFVLIGSRMDQEPQVVWPRETSPDGDPPCLALDPTSDADMIGQLFQTTNQEPARVRFGLREVFAMWMRPLLPHESGCRDVQRQLLRFDAYDATLDFYQAP